MDTWAHNRTADHLDRPKYNIEKEKYGFQNNLYRKLQNMQQQLIGYQIPSFDNILFSNCKTNSIIWIFRWTHWASCRQSTQFRQVGRLPLNCTSINCSGGLIIQTTNLATVEFQPAPGPKANVWNRCNHYQHVVYIWVQLVWTAARPCRECY